MTSEPEVLVEVSDGVGRLTLNRPRAINALTEAMCATMLDGLRAWSAPASGVRAVELHGAGERGLCAGADIKAIRALHAAAAQAFFRTEYTLNHAIATHRLPYTASMNGIVMGGGLGVSAHGSRRIVRPDTRVAMPETIIGFVPDVGILWHLSRAGLAGVHAALTGSTFGAGDALLLGLADECDGEAPAATLDAADWLYCYAEPDAASIVAALEAHPDPQARAAASDLRLRSPLAVCVTLEAIWRAAGMGGVADVLEQDYVLAATMVPTPEFAEGVRAQVIDKDRTPRWRHARIEDVTRDEVLACFEPPAGLVPLDLPNP